ncbi:MAG: Ig-like domain-containing protein, partial [Planctomycetota bacterium]
MRSPSVSPLLPTCAALALASLPACSGGAALDGGSDDPEPSVGVAALNATQDRDADASGATLIVEFDAAVDPVDAQNESRYIVTGTSVVEATYVDPTTVQLELDRAVIPGETVVTVPPGLLGADGSVSSGTTGLAIASTDVDPPSATRIGGVAVAGLAGDQATVSFDDQMVEADVEQIATWSLESPVGVPLSLQGATVTYDDATVSATITLGADQFLETGTEISAVLTGVRDLGGNVIESTAFGSNAVTSLVTGDTVPPRLLSVYPGDAVHSLRFVFDEPVRFVETADLLANVPVSGTRFEFESPSAPGTIREALTSTAILDGLGAEVTFAAAPAVNDLATVFGVTDLAGNEIQPVLAQGVEARLTGGPDLFNGSTELISIEGEHNDIFRMTFDRDLHPENLFDYRFYGLLEGFFVNTHGARPTWDGGPTVTFELVGEDDHEFQTASVYHNNVAGLRSAQGELIDGTAREFNLTVTGDSAAPTLISARLDPAATSAAIVTFSEAVDVDIVDSPGSHFDVGGSAAVSAILISPRVIRATFPAGLAPGETLTVQQAALRDRAGNTAGSSAGVAIQAADASTPGLTSVVATATAGKDVDTIVVAFDELIDPASALNGASYSLTGSGAPVTLTNAAVRYASASNAVTIELPDTMHLTHGESVTFAVTGVRDVAGNEAASLSQAVTVVGDS